MDARRAPGGCQRETGRWEELTGLCRVAAAVGRDALGLGASFVLQYASRVLVRLSATRQADELTLSS